MTVNAKIADSRTVTRFRGTPREAITAFGDMARRVTYKTQQKGFMGMEIAYTYSLHIDETAAWKATNTDSKRRKLVGV